MPPSHQVHAKGIKPEFIPPSKGAAVGGNFDAEFTSERPQDSHVASALNSQQQKDVRLLAVCLLCCHCGTTYTNAVARLAGQLRRIHVPPDIEHELRPPLITEADFFVVALVTASFKRVNPRGTSAMARDPSCETRGQRGTATYMREPSRRVLPLKR